MIRSCLKTSRLLWFGLFANLLSHSPLFAATPRAAYGAWAEQHFGPAAAAESQRITLWGEQADPDGDGLTNVLEYALDTDPNGFTIPPTAANHYRSNLLGEQPGFTITAIVRTDDPDLVVFPQASADNAVWLPFVQSRADLNLTESIYVTKIEELVPRRGLKQITWAVRSDLVGFDPSFLRLTALLDPSGAVVERESAPVASARPVPARRVQKPARAVRAATATASTPSLPGLAFTSQNSAAVGAGISSNTVVVRGLRAGAKVRVTAPEGVTLVVNGIERGQSYLVGNGDTLALKAVAPPSSGESVTRTIRVGAGSVTWTTGARAAAALNVPAGSLAGCTPVNASVGVGGDANISIPITVSPGIGGIEPKLSINYNSQEGNGHLGTGFSIGGLSVITRVAANEAIDGTRGAVTLTASDRFTLDGTRLIPVQGANGENGTTYEKELHDFSRIRSEGRIGSGPRHWIVQTKTGLTLEYGRDDDARRVWKEATEILSWQLSRVKDSVGNEMRFIYSQENGDTLIKRIEYTANATTGTPARNTVEFIYDGRPDGVIRYFQGEAKELGFKLVAIRCSNAGKVVRSYAFTYQQAELSGQLQLTQIQESGAAGSDGSAGPAFPPTVFQWARSTQPPMTMLTAAQSPSLGQMGFSRSPASFTLQGDFNGDGRMDVLQLDDHGRASAWIAFGRADGTFDFRQGLDDFLATDTVFQSSGNLRTGDFNGDGRSDVFYIDTNKVKNFVALSRGDGSFAVQRGPALGALQNATFSSNYSQVLTMDANGDGLTDVVVVNPSPSPAQPNRVYLARLDALALTFEEVADPGADFRTVRVSDSRPTYSWVMVGDYNGDGRADILHTYYDGKGHWLALSNGNGTFTVRPAAQLGGLAGLSFALSYSYMVSADYNGDGLTDVINFQDEKPSQAWVSYAKGDGTFTPPVKPPGLQAVTVSNSGGTYTHLYAGDFNGDGTADILQAYYPASQLSFLAYGTNGRDFTVRTRGQLGVLDNQAFDTGAGASRVLVGDFDGDGTDDVLHLRYNRASWLARSTGYSANRIERVTNGHGLYTRFEYQPMTNPAVYEKGTGARYPLMNFVSPMPMVARLITRNGIDGDASAPNPGAAAGESVSTYRYTDVRAHLRGRGLQAPRTFIEYNEGKGVQTTNFFGVDSTDPLTEILLAGQQTGTEMYLLGSGRLVNALTNFWQLQPRSTAPQARTYQVQNSGTVERTYAAESGALLKTATVSGVTYDRNGNVRSSQAATKDETTGQEFGEQTTNTYADQESDARYFLGRLRTSTVTKTSPGQPPLTRQSQFDYDATTGLLTLEVREPGNPRLRTEKRYRHDAFGNTVWSEVRAWNGVGQPALNEGRVTETTYTEDKRFIARTTNSLGHAETTAHEPLYGAVSLQVGPNRIQTEVSHDAFGRPEVERRIDGSETRTWYRRCTPGVEGAPARAVHCAVTQSSANPASTVYFDVLDREIRRTLVGFDGRLILIDRVYNERGELARVSLPYFAGESPLWTIFQYDAIGRVIREVAPGDRVTTTVYDKFTSTVTNPESRTAARRTDARGYLIAAVDADGEELTYEYDAYGNLLTVSDALGRATSAVTYDNAGRKLSLSEPNTGRTTYEYNGFGEMIRQTTSDQRVTTFEYDRLGRLVGRREPEGAARWFYDYFSSVEEGIESKSVGKLVAVSQPGYSEYYRFDRYGRPIETVTQIGAQITTNPQNGRKQTGERFAMTTAYDYVGRVDTVTWPTGFSVRNVYNAAGHLAWVENAASGVRYWRANSVNARGQVERETLGNGAVTERTFAPATGLAATIRTTGSGGRNLQDLSFRFDQIGNLTERRDANTGLSERFSYDRLARLASAATSGVVSDFPEVRVSYDPLGNVLSRTDAGEMSYGETFSSAGRLWTAGPHAVTSLSARPGGAADLRYGYDARGNRVRTERRVGDAWVTELSVRFNTANLPVLIVAPRAGGASAEAGRVSSATFSYAPDRSRYRQIQRLGTGVVLDRLYVGRLYERETRGTIQRHVHYIPAGGGVVAIEQTEEGLGGAAPRTLYLHKDHLGSIETLSDQAGRFVERFSYDAWGRRRAITQAGGAFRVSYVTAGTDLTANVSRGFTGHEMLDAFGLIHMNGRVYDPITGRFLSADPVVQEIDNLQNLNRYSYVLNNPLSLTDPSGLSFAGKIGKFFSKHWRQIVAAVVTVVVAVVAPYLLSLGGVLGAALSGAVTGFGQAFSGALLSGGSLGDALRAGLRGGLRGAATAVATLGLSKGIGFDAGSVGNEVVKSALKGLETYGKGGKFAHGFLQGLADNIQSAIAGSKPDVFTRVLGESIAGGIEAKLGGGKFFNGAITGAFKGLYDGLEKRSISGKILGINVSLGLEKRGDGYGIALSLDATDALNRFTEEVYGSLSESLLGKRSSLNLFEKLSLDFGVTATAKDGLKFGVDSTSDIAKEARKQLQRDGRELLYQTFPFIPELKKDLQEFRDSVSKQVSQAFSL